MDKSELERKAIAGDNAKRLLSDLTPYLDEAKQEIIEALHGCSVTNTEAMQALVLSLQVESRVPKLIQRVIDKGLMAKKQLDDLTD